MTQRACLVLVLAAAACDSDRSPSSNGDTSQDTAAADGHSPTHARDTAQPSDTGDLPLGGLYGPGITEVVVEVDYQTGAAPYTGSELLFGDIWDLFLTNLEAMFRAHPRTLTVDTTLPQMDELTDVTEDTFDVDAILAIADRHRDEEETATRRTFYVLFLDGLFEDGEGPRNTVLGVSIGRTGVVAMFKPVIDGTGSLASRVEQTTLVHELGHAAGLVNNGVDAANAGHHDADHGAHCTNNRCVMYWQNEVGANAVDFVTQNVLSNTAVLFDQDCLDDMAAAGTP